MEKAKEFIEQLIELKKYWVNQHPTNSEEAVDGFIFSFLVMCDGDSGMNDFHPLTIFDTIDEQPMDDGMPLHEQYSAIRDNEGGN